MVWNNVTAVVRSACLGVTVGSVPTLECSTSGRSDTEGRRKEQERGNGWRSATT